MKTSRLIQGRRVSGYLKWAGQVMLANTSLHCRINQRAGLWDSNVPLRIRATPEQACTKIFELVHGYEPLSGSK